MKILILLILCSGCCIAYDIQETIEMNRRGEKVRNTLPYFVEVVYTNDSTLLNLNP